VRLAKSTRYALAAALEMTEAYTAERPITAAAVAARHHAPEDVVAKVFQRLVRAGLARGTRGLKGGYRLAAKPSTLTVLDVMQVFEPAAVASRDEGSRPDDPRLVRLIDEVDELVSSTFASITLATLAGVRRRDYPEGPSSPRGSRSVRRHAT
jgi:Rrf2 family protein